MSDTSPDLPALLAQFARRYRRRLLTRAGMLIALGLGCLGLLAWRLQAVALGRVWVVGLPGALALIAAAALGWWLRRSWISRQGAANYLDQAFGLEQRLVTAAEFAQIEQKSSLYPLLLEDAARRLSSDRLRTPRPFTRVTAVLALALLLLLAWPGRGRMPLRLAQWPMTPTLPLPPSASETSDQSQPSTASRPQPGTDHASSPQGAGASPSQAGAQGQRNAQQTPPQDNAGSGGPADADPSTGQGGSATQPGDPSTKQDGSATQSGGPSTEQGGSATQSGGSSQPKEQGQNGQAASQGQQSGQSADRAGAPRQSSLAGSADGSVEGRSPSTDQSTSPNQRQGKNGTTPKASGNTEDGGPSTEQGGPATQSGGSSQPQSGASQPQQAGGKSKASEGSGQSAKARSSAEETGRGGGQATMAQEAMQSEIQQLLKEVSGELQELQTQLAAAQDQPHPAPGTSTDPELYGAAAALDRSTGAPLAIQLDTDAEETKAQRPGSGVGKPSGDVSADAPKALAENAQLSDTPVEETSTARQPLPPDYRNVFDRLRREVVR